MWNKIMDVFKGKDTEQLMEVLKDKNVTVLDVRTPGEFSGGHVKGAVNIPLQQLESRMKDVKKLSQPIVLCCASGMRSASARGILKNHGIEAVDGGGWQNVEQCKC